MSRSSFQFQTRGRKRAAYRAVFEGSVLRRSPVWAKQCIPLFVLALTACAKSAPPQAAPQALPVQTQTIAAAPVPQYDEYVSTIKSRRSATINPQVDGNLVKIYVHSGDRVHTGQILMEIDPAKQEATVTSSHATEQQKLAVFEYNQIEVERQRKLFEQGVSSRDAFDQAEQSYKNSQADYESAVATTQSQKKQLGYTTLPPPLRASSAMCRFTWATMSLPPPC